MDIEPETTICDRCSQEFDLATANAGPEGSEWEGATLDGDCYAEVLDEMGEFD